MHLKFLNLSLISQHFQSFLLSEFLQLLSTMANGNHNALFSNPSFCVSLVESLEFSKTFFDQGSSSESRSSAFDDKYMLCWYDQGRETAESSSDAEALMNVLITEDLHESYLDFSDHHKKVLKLPSSWYEKEELRLFSASDFDLSKFQRFLAVRHITLSLVELTSDSLEWLISKCKFLEVLSLNKCRNLDAVDIPEDVLCRLRSLSIEDCSPLEHGITVSVEGLKSFRLSQPFQTKFSITNRIEELDLDSSDDSVPLPMVPSNVDEFQQMAKLKLSGYDLINFSSSFRNVGGISEIVLYRVNLPNESLQWLLENCTYLQHLTLKKCRKLGKVDISELTIRLRSLSIDDCPSVINGPYIRSATLQSFKYHGLPRRTFHLANLDILQEGELDFGLLNEYTTRGSWSDYVDWLLYEILINMHTATVLSVCSFVTQMVRSWITRGSGLSFDNVTHLKLKTGLLPIEFDGILTLLKCCPKLKTLSVQMGQTIHLIGLKSPDNLDKFWEQLISQVDSSSENTEYLFLTSMEVLEMENFSGGDQDQEMQFLEFFLRNGPNLKEMVITTSKNVNPDLHMDKAKRLLNIPKASPGANVSIQ